MVAAFNIAGHRIGPGHPCFIIAEAGVNHNGKVELAHRLIDVAVEAGADAVKFQTFTTEMVLSRDAPKAEYQIRTTGADETQFEMIKRLELPPEAFGMLKGYCEERNILFMSSPFEEGSADLLDDLGVVAFKIPSGEITNLPFLAHVARKNRPMIVSTGMSKLGEVETAVRIINDAGNRELALLQCTSNYPAKPEDANLLAMRTMEQAFGFPTGYSDHTLGVEVPLAAVALGACVIEKHFTLDRNLTGPDHRASLEPEELAAMVRSIRVVEAAMGDGSKRPAASEADTTAVARKSLMAARDIPAGTVLTEKLVTIKRPGTGLPPAMRPHLVGRTLRESVAAGALFSLEMLA